MTRKKREPHFVDPEEISENARKKYNQEDTDIVVKFALTFNELLETNSVDQETLAADTGISTGIISDYRRGKKAPGLLNLYKIANRLGVDCNYLMTGIRSEHYNVAEFTGLSEGAIKQLHENKVGSNISISGKKSVHNIKMPPNPEYQKEVNAVNALLEDRTGRVILNNIYNYLFTEIDGFSLPDRESPKHEYIGSMIGICEKEKTVYDLSANTLSGIFLANVQQGLTKLRSRIKGRG